MYKNPKSFDQHFLMLGKSSKAQLPSFYHKSVSLVVASILCIGNFASAQEESSTDEPASTENEEDKDLSLSDEPAEETEKLDPSKASIRTRPDARTMTLSIPAPRGQITDRFGYPFAQNTVVLSLIHI